LVYINNRNDTVVLLPYPGKDDELLILWPNADNFFSTNTLDPQDNQMPSIAKQLNISPSYLSNKFKEETGETLKTFIARQKIEEAKNLIVYSDLSIGEIYSVLNFHDQSYFIKVFKKLTGLTPKQFKNNLIIKPS
jgi:AraC-like DNA-binding protein